jgi:ubiquitin C-terminal hydrolase
LTRFVEKIEEKIKNTKERFLFDNILGGTTLQQIICTNSECRNISERREKIIYLSVDIKGNHTLEDCLDKFISEEKIEDYNCEKCNKKITNIKKVLIDKLPNILIIHLQRISFNYETFLMEKINDDITFEPKLNIKKFTVDKNNKDVDTEKYEYEYIGVIVHSGTAQSGHYYSIIQTNVENKIYKFNDTSVTEISYDNLQREFISNNNRDFSPSPYMLLFQKKIKNPVIVNIREITDSNNI